MEYLTPLLPNTVYHIYNHANGNENLFRSEENYRYFLKKYAEYIYPIAETFAYCLMPNHFHFMVRIRGEEELVEFFKTEKINQYLRGFVNLGGIGKKEEKESGLRNLGIVEKLLSQQFSNFFNSYTKAYNKKYNRRGSLFNHRFKRKVVENDSYFIQLVVYIHLNPVKHGFCSHLLDWEYSSIHAYYSEAVSLINKSLLDDVFGSRDAMVHFHQKYPVKEQLFEFN